MERSEGIAWNAEAFEKLIKYQTYMDELHTREAETELELAA